MITKSMAFSKAWQAYQKNYVPERAPYYHFEVGFRAAWIARTALKAAERRKTAHNSGITASPKPHFCTGCKWLPVHAKSKHCRMGIRFRGKTEHSRCSYKNAAS